MKFCDQKFIEMNGAALNLDARFRALPKIRELHGFLLCSQGMRAAWRCFLSKIFTMDFTKPQLMERRGV